MNTSFKSLKAARQHFLSTMPAIVDTLMPMQTPPAGHRQIKVLEWDGSDDATHTKTCPDHPHDCWTEGGGVEWQDSYSFGAALIVDGKTIARWENFDRGGLGF